MFFGQQLRALFRHLYCQMQCQTVGLLRTFDFGNVLCARTARHNSYQKCAERAVFVAFQLQICFALQRHAAFHLQSGQMAPPAALGSLLFDPAENQPI